MAHRVFISYHHANDQKYKDTLVKFGKDNDIFVDWSVDTGDISDELTTEQIREKIRDEYLRDSTVTIVLVGTETKKRKHVDWEIYSSMHDGKISKKSGLLVIYLPTTQCTGCHAAHDGEKENVFSETTSWSSVTERAEYEKRYPEMPDRIIDNWLYGAKISAISWNDLTAYKLKYLIEKAFENRAVHEYDLSRPMRKHNS